MATLQTVSLKPKIAPKWLCAVKQKNGCSSINILLKIKLTPLTVTVGARKLCGNVILSWRFS